MIKRSSAQKVYLATFDRQYSKSDRRYTISKQVGQKTRPKTQVNAATATATATATIAAETRRKNQECLVSSKPRRDQSIIPGGCRAQTIANSSSRCQHQHYSHRSSPLARLVQDAHCALHLLSQVSWLHERESIWHAFSRGRRRRR